MEDVLRQLELRDKFEKKDNEYFNAFNQLVQKLGTESDPDPSLILENYKPRNDLQQLRNENSDLISNLNNQTLINESLESEIKNKDGIIDSLQIENTRLMKRIDHLSLEIKEKNKTIELINDEVLTSNLQLTVLKQQLTNQKK